MKKRIKIDGLILFCIFWTLVFFSNGLLRGMSVSPMENMIMISMGITFFLIGHIIRISARGFKSEYSQNGFSLIQGGPYSFVRNPMYLGTILITLGISLIILKWWSVCFFISLFVMRYTWVIREEESKLTAIFSQQYRSYQDAVPRILPSAVILFKRDISEYLPLRKSWVKREIGHVIVSLLVILFLSIWMEIKQQGLKICPKEILPALLTAILFICLSGYLVYQTKNAADKI